MDGGSGPGFLPLNEQLELSVVCFRQRKMVWTVPTLSCTLRPAAC